MWAQNRNFKGVKLLLIKNVNEINCHFEGPKLPIFQLKTAILTLKFLYDLGRNPLEVISSLNTHVKMKKAAKKGVAHPFILGVQLFKKRSRAASFW